MRGRVAPAVSAVISADIREIYNGIYLPSIAAALKQIGLENVRMPWIGGGHSTDVFDTGHGQVLKITNKDIAEENGIRPVSRYVLQPVCTRNLNDLYEVGIYPKLVTSAVAHRHSEALRIMLETEGYVFSDAKTDNIGLSALGVPYVIDADAIYKSDVKSGHISTHCARIFQWPSSQWAIFSCTVKGSSKQLTPDNAGFWKLSESYGMAAKASQHSR